MPVQFELKEIGYHLSVVLAIDGDGFTEKVSTNYTTTSKFAPNNNFLGMHYRLINLVGVISYMPILLWNWNLLPNAPKSS